MFWYICNTYITFNSLMWLHIVVISLIQKIFRLKWIKGLFYFNFSLSRTSTIFYKFIIVAVIIMNGRQKTPVFLFSSNSIVRIWVAVCVQSLHRVPTWLPACGIATWNFYISSRRESFLYVLMFVTISPFCYSLKNGNKMPNRGIYYGDQ